jgi:hypothetical protein
MHAGTFAEEAFLDPSHFHTFADVLSDDVTPPGCIHVMRSPVVLGLSCVIVVPIPVWRNMRGIHAGLSRADWKFSVNRDEAVGNFSVEGRKILAALRDGGIPSSANLEKPKEKNKPAWIPSTTRSKAYQQQKNNFIPNRGIEPRPCRN